MTRRARGRGRGRRPAGRVRGAVGGVGRPTSSLPACAATSASGWTSSRWAARWRGPGCGARRSLRSGARRSRSWPRADLRAWSALATCDGAPGAGPDRAAGPGRARRPRRDVRAGAGAGDAAARGLGRGRAGGAGGRGARDLRFVRRAALAAGAGLAPEVGGIVQRTLEPARDGGGDDARGRGLAPGRAGRAHAAAPHRRGLPPHDRARADPGAVARRGPRLPHARGPGRDPRRALRRLASTASSTRCRRRSRCCARCGGGASARWGPRRCGCARRIP